MEFLTPENITAYGIGGAIVLMIVGILAKDGLVSLIAYLRARGELANKQKQGELDAEAEDDTLDAETRKLANKMAFTALDKAEQLSRLQSEYVAQGEVVKNQILELQRLGQELYQCRDIAVVEYHRQVELLLKQLEEREKTIAEQITLIEQQKTDIAILEATK